MEVSVTGRHCELSERFRSHVAEKLTRLEKHDHRIIRVQVEVEDDSSVGRFRGSRRCGLRRARSARLEISHLNLRVRSHLNLRGLQVQGALAAGEVTQGDGAAGVQ